MTHPYYQDTVCVCMQRLLHSGHIAFFKKTAFVAFKTNATGICGYHLMGFWCIRENNSTQSLINDWSLFGQHFLKLMICNI